LGLLHEEESAEFGGAVLEVEVAFFEFDEGVETGDGDVVDADVAVEAAAQFDLVFVFGELDDVEAFGLVVHIGFENDVGIIDFRQVD